MTIEFKCENCLKQYRLKDSLAGKKVRCKDCSETMVVPRIASAVDDENSGSYQLETTSSKPRKKFSISDEAITPQKKKNRASSARSGRRKSLMILCGTFFFLFAVGFLFAPKTIKVVMMFWTFFSMIAIGVGLLWLAFNCFKTAPIAALMMVLLPFIGFVVVSNQIDLFNEKNDPPFRLAVRGLCSFVAALVATLVMAGIQDNPRFHPAPPSYNATAQRNNFRDHNLNQNNLPRDNSNGSRQQTGGRLVHHPIETGRTSTTPFGGRAAGSRINPNVGNNSIKRKYNFGFRYSELPKNADQLITELEPQLTQLSGYIAQSIKIDEEAKRIHFFVSERPRSELIRPFLKLVRSSGIKLASATKKINTPSTPTTNPFGGKTESVGYIFNYKELSDSKDIAVEKINEALKGVPYVDTNRTKIYDQTKKIFIRFNSSRSPRNRNKIKQLLTDAGFDIL